MEKVRIYGGNRLNGKIPISGAKNAALPLMAASLLTADSLVLENVPRLDDIASMRTLLQGLGTTVTDRASSGKRNPRRAMARQQGTEHQD